MFANKADKLSKYLSLKKAIIAIRSAIGIRSTYKFQYTAFLKFEFHRIKRYPYLAINFIKAKTFFNLTYVISIWLYVSVSSSINFVFTITILVKNESKHRLLPKCLYFMQIFNFIIHIIVELHLPWKIEVLI